MMKSVKCQISGEEFVVSELEQNLRKKFGFGASLPTVKPKYRFRELGAFWPHWNLHARKCDKTRKNIISIFRPDCAYPVWHRDEWVKHADPPSADVDFSQEFFPQAWRLFQKCPIPHRTGTGNTNCEYSSNAFYSKNCYLCEFPYNSEDLRLCYRAVNTKDSMYSAYCFDSELTVDLCNSRNCFDSFFLLQCRNVQSSSFLYDCRNCSDCLFCFNLRNKKYCFGNQQLTKEEFLRKKSEWNFKSRKAYDKAKEFFRKMMKEKAWHRAQSIDLSENSNGDHIENSKDLVNGYFSKGLEGCCNVLRNLTLKDSLDCTSAGVNSELLFYSSNVVDNCYQNMFCFDTPQSKYMTYSAYCFQCENCFGCCGLVGKKYCIFNKQYTKEEYENLRKKIIEHMKKTGEWGKFFPGIFAPNPYDESWSSFHFPLSDEEKKRFGFRSAPNLEREAQKTAEISEIPDSVDELDEQKTEWLTKQIFWDSEYKRPFQIQKADIEFSKKLGIPLPNTYYMNRIQENFRWMPFDGELRETVCGKSQEKILTSWGAEYDGRILCEKEYLEVLE